LDACVGSTENGNERRYRLCRCRSGSSQMRVTTVGSTRTCAVCERTLLMGERAVRFAPDEGSELVDVCPLCQELAVEAGWIKEGAPPTPTRRGGRARRRRKRNLVEYLGLTRAPDQE